MKVEEQLQLARIQIAQMKDEIAELTSRPDWTAREKELNERHARELYEQKMFFKDLMEEQKESHRIEMADLRKTLKEESDRIISQMEEAHKREIESLKSQQNDHEAFLNRQIEYLNKGMAELKQQLKDSQLSEDEKGALVRWWQRRNFRRSTEQQQLLNGRNPKSRQEEKEHMCDDSDDDITNPNGTASQTSVGVAEGQEPAPSPKKKEEKKDNTRIDYSKNKPYTANPQYIKLVKQGLTGEARRKARLKRSRKIMDSIKKELEKYERSGYKRLGVKIKQALVYAKKEWHAFETVLQNGDVELSNNICEQMMRHIKMNLKNSMNIGSEESALDYAFMFSALESCDINHLSPEAYLRKLILGIHEKKVEKKQLLPCYIGL